MNFDKAKEIHDLLFTFMGLFHEKFLHRYRHESICMPCLKKNHTKILNILYQKDHITLTEIGKLMDIEKGSLTTLIDQLEEKDLVIRSNDPMDRRKSLISLSPQGREEMDRVMNLYAQKMDELLRDADLVEIQHFLTSLQFVVKFMKKI
ncbi:MarR family winged helix-turn-helix transcriptional regulator [Desulfitobacterium sp.]|uniref:MarR family winged helix-turn-helix transcriptional regulator n=1 Tax=Desulfitobacterium sp. TaxID=49981 RepID=UPI002BE4D93B|nr:MarR family transcriptional regulator [Desulfitobacterium sp.]HVJ50541.1 MarR family transcriptional regulator [Desulfitobacterium sp.]